MTHRERVLAALAHRQPDRCPVDFWAVPEVVERLLKHFGAREEAELYDLLDVDMQFVFPCSTLPDPEILPDGSYFDRMGVHRRPVRNEYCTYDEYASYPLAYAESVADLERYDKWPDPDAFDWAHFAAQIAPLHEKRFLKLHAGGIFEYAWALRGYEQFMMDLCMNPDMVHYIMDKFCTYWCKFIRNAMEAAGEYLDMVYTYDDIAAQNALLLAPEMLEEFVYPYHRRMNSVIKSYGKPIMYHSCGAVLSQLPKLAELPIDVLNPLQPMAKGMDFQWLKDNWGERLSFHGGLCLQSTLPKGTPDEVREAVRRAVSILGKNGGYIMTSAHYLQNDIPTENILAMYEPELRKSGE
ncbi:methylcobalamin:coenzyme M methyltransferase [uncultured Flavonifractor sp.]|nr:methylcobalamin:coenzyme M methyltransferase [uncultured Flavonifractor sp.]